MSNVWIAPFVPSPLRPCHGGSGWPLETGSHSTGSHGASSARSQVARNHSLGLVGRPPYANPLTIAACRSLLPYAAGCWPDMIRPRSHAARLSNCPALFLMVQEIVNYGFQVARSVGDVLAGRLEDVEREDEPAVRDA